MHGSGHVAAIAREHRRRSLQSAGGIYVDRLFAVSPGSTSADADTTHIPRLQNDETISTSRPELRRERLVVCLERLRQKASSASRSADSEGGDVRAQMPGT